MTIETDLYLNEAGTDVVLCALADFYHKHNGIGPQAIIAASISATLFKQLQFQLQNDQRIN